MIRARPFSAIVPVTFTRDELRAIERVLLYCRPPKAEGSGGANAAASPGVMPPAKEVV